MKCLFFKIGSTFGCSYYKLAPHLLQQGQAHFSLQTKEGHSCQKQTASEFRNPVVRLYTLKKGKGSIFCPHEHFSCAIYINFDQHSDSLVTMIPLNVQSPCSTHVAKKVKSYTTVKLEDYSLLGCDSMLFSKVVPEFVRVILYPSSR